MKKQRILRAMAKHSGRKTTIGALARAAGTTKKNMRDWAWCLQFRDGLVKVRASRTDPSKVVVSVL